MLIAGLLWRAAPHALLTQVRNGSLGLISSPALLAELADVLARTKFDAIFARSKTSREKALAEVHELAELIHPPPLSHPVCRDPDDDAVLALAVAARADFVVSGDNNLIVLQQFSGIPILNPAQAAVLLEAVGKT